MSELAFIHRWERINGYPGWCRVIVARSCRAAADVVLIGGAVREKDTGVSVTNGSEWIAASVYRDHLDGLVAPESVRFWEIYADELRIDPATGRLISVRGGFPCVDAVTYEPQRYIEVGTSRVETERACAALGLEVVRFFPGTGDPPAPRFGTPKWRPASPAEAFGVHALIQNHLTELDLDPPPLAAREEREMAKRTAEFA